MGLQHDKAVYKSASTLAEHTYTLAENTQTDIDRHTHFKKKMFSVSLVFLYPEARPESLVPPLPSNDDYFKRGISLWIKLL